MNQMTRIGEPAVEEVRTRLTTAEFLHMNECGAFDDLKVELVDGELQVTQHPKNPHSMRQAELVFVLAQVTRIALVRGEVGIDLGDDTLLGCDVALLREPVTEDRMLRPHDLALVVEVAESTRRRDLGMKRSKYAGAGVAVYWVVDGQHRVVHVHADPVDGDYVEVRTIRFGEPLPVPGTDATITLA